MATYNILTAHTGAGTQAAMAAGDSLFLASSGTLNSLGANGASSTGGNNDLQIYGTLAGGKSAFFGTDGGDLIQIYSSARVLGGEVSAITVDGSTGDNTFINAGSISTHTTLVGTHVVDLEGAHNAVTNTGSITAAQYGFGVYLDGGSNTFNNSGSVTAGTDGAAHARGTAVFINGGGINDTTGLQTITNSGSITALSGEGLFVNDGSNDLSNTGSGVISGSFFGVELRGDHNTVTNAGSMLGGSGVASGSDQTGLFLSGSSNSVHNSGMISGSSGVDIDGGDDTITNTIHAHITGSLVDGILLDDGGNTISNDGYVSGAETGLSVGDGDNALTNYKAGHITGEGLGNDAVFMNDGDNVITNKGHITGGVDGQGVDMGAGSNIIVNAMGAMIQDSLDDATTVAGHRAVYADGGDNQATNAGTIAMHLGDGDDISNMAVLFLGGDNVITNRHSGVITDGAADNLDNWAVYMFGGSNVVTNHGHITGTINLGSDSDSDLFNGGTGYFNGTIYGGDGNDAIELGKGTSTVYGGEGADFLQAGSGSNSFNYAGVGDSYGSGATHFDTVDDFNTAKDSFNFIFHGSAFDAADFTTINNGALTDTNFDADIKADVGSHLHANSAVLLEISGGEYAGDTFLIVDGNGKAGYQHGSDYVVELTNLNGTFSASDIHALL